MGVSVKPVFNRTNRKNETGLYSIHIRLTIDKNRLTIMQSFREFKRNFGVVEKING